MTSEAVFNLNKCFLKEIGVLKQLVIGKLVKIGKMITKHHLTTFNTLRLLLENEEILCVFVTSRHSYPHFYGEFPVRTIFTAYALQMNPCRPTKCVDCTNFPNASKTSSSKKNGHEKKNSYFCSQL